VVEILDLVSRREGLAAKVIARELGVSLSTCYRLLGILLEESYLEKLPHRGGYRLGPAIPLLYGRASGRNLETGAEPVIDELARRTGRHAYLGVLEDGQVTVAQVKAPPESPPVGVVRGFHGASHALALGKVLIAGTGSEGIEEYVERYGFEGFTPRTITDPDRLKAHLHGVLIRGLATDVGEFAENLCCLAVPVQDREGRTRGAIGVSTSARRFESEARVLLELAKWAAREAGVLLEREGQPLLLRDFGGR
jgi:acetyl-CoA synthetase